MNGSNRPFAMPPVIKNIIIINILVFALTLLFQDFMFSHFALFNFGSEYFRPHQIITHMFMHANFGHIFFNMFAVFMFGRVLENVWGSKKMLLFYTVCGLGAAFAQLLVNHIQISKLNELISQFDATPTYTLFNNIVSKYALKGAPGYNEMMNFMQSWFYNPDNTSEVARASGYLHGIVETYLSVPTVGASGAVFGLLIAFAMIFPDVELMIIFFPVPIKAKYLVPLYAVIELIFGVANFQGDNVAHFAHLGGALFGFILVKYWKRNQFRMY
jgi:membrane associated rhomboid family serine protease